jgi:uncharacterized Ntn-hydrolase superfamily protein
MRRWLFVSIVILSVGSFVTRAQQLQTLPPDTPVPGTFSILGFDPETGEIGGAVQSKVFSVGNGVLWVEPGVGAVATQAVVDVGYGPKGIALLREGMAPKDIIKKIWDEDADTTRGWAKTGRQFAVMNMKGDVSAYTGPTAPTEFGDKQGEFCSAQGYTLGSKDVPTAMVDAFEKSITDADGKRRHLSMRLLMAIEAGQAAGGDKRGQQSMALIVAKTGCGVWPHNDIELHLQVDDSDAPIVEMRRLVVKALAPRSGQVPCYQR